MAFRRTLFLVRMPLVIHVVQKSDGLPQIRVGAVLFREMFHRIRDGVTVPAQTFGLDPFVQNGERAFFQHYSPQVTTKRFKFGSKSVAAWINMTAQRFLVRAQTIPKKIPPTDRITIA